MVRRRAKVNGLTERIRLQRTARFDHAFAGQNFDPILGYATLHHLPLEGLAERIWGRLRRGGVAVFAEPVVNSALLGAVRRCVP